MSASKRLALLAFALAGAGLGVFQWLRTRPEALPPGIVVSNGRLEATEIDIATKLAGRVQSVTVEEGDFVQANQVVATINTDTLAAQLLEAQAQMRRARFAIATAKSIVAQRESELALAKRDLERTEELVAKGRGFVAESKVDADRTRVLTTKAGVETAESLVVEAESAHEAAQATIRRIEADIEDCALRAPRAGRVQYRLAEPGEVLPAGGKVVTVLDLDFVYMTVFLDERVGVLAIGAEARIVLDAAPQFVIPATISFVSAEAQFTPKAVETAQERQKLAFRVKVRVDRELLRRHPAHTKVGLPGVAYVRLDARVPWPESLENRAPP